MYKKFILSLLLTIATLAISVSAFAADENEISESSNSTTDRTKYQTFYDAENIEVYNIRDMIYIKNADMDRLLFVLDTCDEYQYTTARLNLRDLPNVNSDPICTLPENAKVHVVGVSRVGWSIVQIEDINYFMWDEYLSDEPIDSTPIIEITSIDDYIPKVYETAILDDTSESINYGYTESVSTPSYSSSYLGTYKLTAYCNCSSCCGQWAGGPTASGSYPVAGRTIACDLPFGTQVSINGNIYTVEDRGVSGNHIDIYFGSHSEALSFGMQYADVYIVG